jgi:hypothetical protein
VSNFFVLKLILIGGRLAGSGCDAGGVLLFKSNTMGVRLVGGSS